MVETLECPSCGATLRNVSVLAGQKSSCLNCGARFAAAAAPAENASDLSHVVASPTLPAMQDLGREPRAAGYWFLRIPALVFAVAGTLLCLILTFEISKVLFSSSRIARSSEWAVLFYLPLLPVYGIYFVLLTRALHRIEAQTLHAAWRMGILSGALPAVPGSSLPYMAPLIIGGATLMISVIVVSSWDDYSRSPAGSIMFSLGTPAFCVALAFMFTDLRQFFWRQCQIAKAFCAPLPAGELRYEPSALGGVAAATLLAACGIPFSVALREWENLRYYPNAQVFNPAVILCILAGLTLCGCAYSVYRVCRNFSEALGWWSQAGKRAGVGPVPPEDSLFRALWIVVIVEECWLTAFLFYTLGNEDRTISIFSVIIGIIGGSMLLIVAAQRLSTDIRKWREAHRRAWRIRGQAFSQRCNETRQEYGGYRQLLFHGTLVLIACEVVALLVSTLGIPTYRPVEAIFVEGNMLFAFHVSTLWMALTAREIFRLERSCELLAALSDEHAERA